MTAKRKIALKNDVMGGGFWTRTYTELEDGPHCPGCGKKGDVFIEDGAGDYYLNEEYCCLACGASGHMWMGRPDAGHRDRLLEGLKNHDAIMREQEEAEQRKQEDYEKRRAEGKLTANELYAAKYRAMVRAEVERAGLGYLLRGDGEQQPTPEPQLRSSARIEARTMELTRVKTSDVGMPTPDDVLDKLGF
jgi:hypothetical protein